MVRNRHPALSALCGCALALSACASVGTGDPAAFEGAEYSDGAVRSGDEEIAVTIWPAIGPVKARLLALHGFGDRADLTFRRAAEYWTTRGIEVIAYDQRGFGRNPSNGDWPGAEALIRDAGAMARIAAAREPAAPLYLLGHSMGGGVAATAVGEGLAAADGLILAAPAIWDVPLLYRASARLAASMTPEKRWSGDGLVTIQASDNIEALREMGRDPYYVAPPSSREFLGLIHVNDRAIEALPKIATPTLLLYGDKDQVIPRASVEAARAALNGERYIEYPEGWHLLFRDLQAETVWRDVADFALGETAAPEATMSATER